MKCLLCFLLGTLCSLAGFSQISFKNVIETGVALPLGGKSANGALNGGGIHLGNHLDLSFGNDCFKWGIGAYIGHTRSLDTDSKYKEEGMALARKYQLTTGQISFNAAPFQSTQLLLGPVASLGAGATTLHLWAKGGLGLNTPGRYAVTYRDGDAEQKIYETGSDENKNALAYDIGAGFSYLFSWQLGLRLSASYSSTKTDLVNYRYDREKGTAPLYMSASNNFIKASVGLVFHLQDSRSSNSRNHHTPRSGSQGRKREAGSGLATGRRTYRPGIIETGGDSVVYSPREAGSGLATGRRMHKPVVISIDPGGDGVVESREAGSGLATGRRMHKPIVIIVDPGTSQNQSRNSGVNPLYESSGSQGENPLFEGMAAQGGGETANGALKQITKVILRGDEAEIEGIMEKNGKEYRVIINGKVIKTTELPKR